MGDVLMPRLSDTIDEGTIIDWLVGEGDAVATEDELVEVQTDKAAATYEAEEAGVLRIREPAGSTVPVGAVIAELV
jgi:pyruvate dehydrogenase E2 component (dihydrolipoamide acetyltransferase)